MGPCLLVWGLLVWGSSPLWHTCSAEGRTENELRIQKAMKRQLTGSTSRKQLSSAAPATTVENHGRVMKPRRLSVVSQPWVRCDDHLSVRRLRRRTSLAPTVP